MKTIHELLIQALNSLHPSDTAKIDAEILLAFVLQKPRVFLFSYPEYKLDNEHQKKYLSLIHQRQSGYPVAYLTGRREFWSLPLRVTPATLIPRHETELLVEAGLDCIAHIDTPHILELGTGSGAISLALAKERPSAKITALDISQQALNIARYNAKQLNFPQIQFLHSNWFLNLPENKYHLIISNPPYLSQNDSHLIREEIRFEPPEALISDDDGFDAIRHIIHHSGRFLEPNGWLCLEHGYNQAEKVQILFDEAHFHSIKSLEDLQGHLRVTLGKYRLS